MKNRNSKKYSHVQLFLKNDYTEYSQNITKYPNIVLKNSFLDCFSCQESNHAKEARACKYDDLVKWSCQMLHDTKQDDKLRKSKIQIFKEIK